MVRFSLPYGQTQLTAELNGTFDVETLAPVQVPPAENPAQVVRAALARPVGGVRLAELVGAQGPARRSVAIAINDKTRPVPHDQLLPPLLEELHRLGIRESAITFIIATGLHGAMAESELGRVLPAELLARYRVISHDVADTRDLIDLGKTTRGTPIEVNRLFARADLRLVVGNLEPHQFMGFSGGVKTAAIGLAGRATVDANHAFMLDPRSDLARYEDNPARQDVEEIGRSIGVQFALNAVINENKQIVNVLAGEPQAVMQQGIPLVLRIYEARVRAPFDLMIVSSGGHPKDINLYQAQKALGHAARVSRKGGTIILVAACPEGSGSRAYEQWVIGMPSHEAVLERFKREGFRIGPHKAFQIARDASPRRLLVVTQMPAEFARRLLLVPCASLEAALALALKELSPHAQIGLVPCGNATIPIAGWSA